MTEIICRDLFVGRTSDGARLYLTAELRDKVGDFRTIDHEPTGAYRELSIVGDGFSKGQRESDFGGQCVATLRDVASRAASRPAGSRQDLATLADISDRWHLNGMRSACAHQARVGESTDDALKLTPPCPNTGYRWGSAWLVEALPDEVVTDLRRIVATLG